MSHFLKKIIAPLAATIAFIGLAGWVIFSAESTFSPFQRLPSNANGNLTADIAANVLGDGTTTNVPLADATAAPTDQTIQPDQPTNATNASDTTDTGAIANTTITTTTDVTADATTPRPTSEVSPASIFPKPREVITLADTSTIAIPTVTVDSSTVTTAAAPNTPVVPSVASPVDSQGLALPYTESNFTNNENWLATWGTMTVTQKGFLHLTANGDSTGGAAYLNDSGSWTNYTFAATLDWQGGKIFGLMANYRDASNYILCEFRRADSGGVTMQLKEYRGGREMALTPLTAASTESPMGSDITASIAVNGIYGTCSFNGQTVSNSAAGPGVSSMASSTNGAIGFAAHDPNPGASDMVIKYVRVTDR